MNVLAVVCKPCQGSGVVTIRTKGLVRKNKRTGRQEKTWKETCLICGGSGLSSGK